MTDNCTPDGAEARRQDLSKHLFLTTGAQRHFVFSRAAYVSLAPYIGPQVKASGVLQTPIGIGVARAQVAAPSGGSNTLYLRDALCCPSSSANIVSISCLLKAGIFWDTGRACLYTKDPHSGRSNAFAIVDRISTGTLFAIRLAPPDAPTQHSPLPTQRSPLPTQRSPPSTQGGALPPLRPIRPRPEHRR